jgi:intracellular multiplication protein IcmB
MKFSHKRNFAESITANFDIILQKINDSFLHVNPRSFVDIATTQDRNTMVMRDGTLLTAIKIHGSTRDVLYNEYVEILEGLEESFRGHMLSGDHYFSFTFKSDNENIDTKINHAWTTSAKSVAKKLELDMDDVIQEMHDVYADACQDEETHVLVWTNVHNMTKPERAQAEKGRNKEMKGVPRHNNAQPFKYSTEAFYEKHRSLSNQLCADFSNEKIKATVVSCDHFIRSLKLQIDEEVTTDNWKPRLPGSPVPMRILADNDADLSAFFHEPISEQIIPRGITSEGEGICRVGGILFAPLSLEHHPMTAKPFAVLLKKVSKLKIPFRMHTLLRNDGMSIFGMRLMMARFLSFTKSDKNERIVECHENLKALAKSGEEIISSQISFCTWHRDPNGMNEIRRRHHALAKAVSSWGSSQTSQAEGDEVESFFSSIGGLTMGTVAQATALPLYDGLKMAPIAQIGSAWEQGSKLYRTETGKLIPQMPYSKQQLAWVKFIMGPMGSGKTVHLNGEHFALLLHPDNEKLPYILNIDIGPGMKGFCDMVRDSLPKHKKHEVIYEKMLNRKDKTINVFDLPLGMRAPFSSQLAFLRIYLEMLCTMDGDNTMPDGTSGFITKLIHLAYDSCAVRRSAKLYYSNRSLRVDEALEKYDLASHNKKSRKVTWYDVVDFLSSKGETHLAQIASRFAVPTLEDLIATISDKRIANSYDSNRVFQTNELLAEYIRRKLSDSLDKYPCISGYTKFDISDARIVSLDLDDIAKGVGVSAAKNLSLMFFLAYFTLTKRIFIGKDILKEVTYDDTGLFPFDYMPHHTSVVSDVERTPKRFSGDETHRFEGDPIAKALLKLAIREGRKWKVDIIQSSQLASDFDKDMLKLATDIIVLGRGNRANVESIVEQFKLPSNLEYRLGSNSMRKPSKDGSTLISLVETSTDRYEQHLISMYGKSFLWATNSTQDDRTVRDSLSESLGNKKARDLLCTLYPAGNLDDEIDEKRRRVTESVTEDKSAIDQSDETPQHILSGIIDDALIYFEKHCA